LIGEEIVIYIVVYFVILLFASIEVLRKPNTRNRKEIGYVKISSVCFLTIILLLLFMAGTREQVGIDYASYERLFNYVDRLKNIRDIIKLLSTRLENEISIYLIMGFCSSINLVIFVYAAIALSLKGFILGKYSSYPCVGILVYYLVYFMGCDMGIIRQCVAMSVLLISVCFIKEKNLKGYVICVFVAFLFHRTSLLFAPAYLVNYIKVRPKILALIATICILFSGIDFSSGINFMLNYLPNSILGKLSTRVYSSSGTIVGLTTLYRITLFWIYSFLLYKIKKDNTKLMCDEYRQNQILIAEVSYKILFIGTCGFYMFRSLYTLSGRGMYYYTCFEALLAPNLIGLIERWNHRVIVFLIIIAIYSVLFFSTLKGYVHITSNYFSYPYVPFKSFLLQ
jgi:hypothetical protein